MKTLDPLMTEAFARMAIHVCERRGRPDLVAAIDRDGATIDVDDDGNYRLTVAGEVVVRIPPERAEAFVDMLRIRRAEIN